MREGGRLGDRPRWFRRWEMGGVDLASRAEEEGRSRCGDPGGAEAEGAEASRGSLVSLEMTPGPHP